MIDEDVVPTDLIAVKNRSHNIFNLFSGSKKTAKAYFPIP